MGTNNDTIDTKVFKNFKQPAMLNENVKFYAVTISNLLVSDGVHNYGLSDNSPNQAVCNIECVGSPKSAEPFKILNITVVGKHLDSISDVNESWPLGVYKRRKNGLNDEYNLLVVSRIQFINTILFAHTNDKFVESELLFTVPEEPENGNFCYPILEYEYQTKTI